eukprot:CAMPEP_0198252700 /NCGR_PEP_ID=MMETSP1447-20131203/3183_1 /TAXON_ID=420782 /ORGANISM="Chaetoceros dichaeta, Strain CCMP1751" /LENGTH=219 /DNA_ID=CAMNT_0043938055 /DNA_START=70 /DNA_END=726 /DNA_ORIENTATION=+
MLAVSLWLVQVVSLLLTKNCNAFAPQSGSSSSITFSSPPPQTPTRMMMVPPLEDLSNILQSSGTDNDFLARTSNLLLSEMTSEKQGAIAKGAIISLLFGGGLIPSAIDANKSLIGTLRGKRRGGEDMSVSDYIPTSNAAGPPLPNSFLLFPSEEIPLVDILAILGRIEDVNSIADWRNLDTAKMVGVDNVNPPMWLPRGDFKKNVRSAKWRGWPKDKSG